MNDDGIVVIFSSFDDKIGQVPLIYTGIDEKTAIKISNQVAMSILATVSEVSSPEDFHGESIIPLIEENIIAAVYYFYMFSEDLSEPSFSFLLYGMSLEDRDKLYANIKGLMEKLSVVASHIKDDVELRLPLLENTIIPDAVEDDVSALAVSLTSLLKESFQSTPSEMRVDHGFVEAMAFSTFEASSMSLHVWLADNINEDDVTKVSFRIILSLLLRLSKTKKKGEAILPDVESNRVVFSYFFPLEEERVGVIFLFSGEEKKMSLYRWAPLLSEELSKIADDIAAEKLIVQLPKRIEEKLQSIYYIDALIEDMFRRTGVTLSLEESTFLREPSRLFSFKNVEKLISAVIAGHPVILVSEFLANSQDLAYLLDELSPHRDVSLKISEVVSLDSLKRWDVVYISKRNAQHLPKEVTVVDVDKKKVKSSLDSPYAKKLVKKLQKLKRLEDMRTVMDDEIVQLLDKVSRLVEASKMDNEKLAKQKIDELLLSLPDPDMFDLIKEMAISFNPVIADLINEKSVYVIRRDLWGM